MTFPGKIVNARRLAGLTQEELALRAKVTVRTIQRIENGHTVPRMHTLHAIADALNVPYREIDPLQDENIPTSTDDIDTSHFLRMFCLSCFSYLVVPYIHFLIPQRLLNKAHRIDHATRAFARALVQEQVWWVVFLHTAMLTTLAFNLLVKDYRGGVLVVSYLSVAFIAYVINFVIVSSYFFRMKTLIGLQNAAMTEK